jgi:hypothetical protein
VISSPDRGDLQMKEKDIKRYMRTIETVVRSPLLEQYLVGVTYLDAHKKAKSYYKIGFEHFITLASPLRPIYALQLEEEMFKRLTKKKTSVLYRKYHHKKRDGIYHPSLGGKSHKDEPCMLVYMAWWNKSA